MSSSNTRNNRVLFTVVGIPLLLFVLFIAWIVVKSNTENLYGYIDRTGRFVLAPKYYMAETFTNGKAQVIVLVRNRLTCDTFYDSVINHNGQVVSQLPYSGECFDSDFRFEQDQPSYMEGSERYPAPTIDPVRVDGGFYKYGYKNKKMSGLFRPVSLKL